jgi:hypothetical protein
LQVSEEPLQMRVDMSVTCPKCRMKIGALITFTDKSRKEAICPFCKEIITSDGTSVVDVKDRDEGEQLRLKMIQTFLTDMDKNRKKWWQFWK